MLLSADYSQVELRIVAHYSGDASLIEAFRNGEDVHRRTAAEVAGIELDEVSDEQRARAKAVNFGIIYGSSAFGLAQQLGIAAGEAQETIDAYFERYEGVRRFLDETTSRRRSMASCRRGWGGDAICRTSARAIASLRQAAERMATNTVIQGTAADLIKKAMVEVDRALGRRGALEATMILQVHDELVFETPEAERRGARRDGAGVAWRGWRDLDVPLTVDLGFGASWRGALRPLAIVASGWPRRPSYARRRRSIAQGRLLTPRGDLRRISERKIAAERKNFCHSVTPRPWGHFPVQKSRIPLPRECPEHPLEVFRALSFLGALVLIQRPIAPPRFADPLPRDLGPTRRGSRLKRFAMRRRSVPPQRSARLPRRGVDLVGRVFEGVLGVDALARGEVDLQVERIDRDRLCAAG